MAGGKIHKKRQHVQGIRGGRIPFEKSKRQHTLKKPMLVESIVQKSSIKPTDVVLEIGPDTGNLTKKLLECAKSLNCPSFFFTHQRLVTAEIYARDVKGKIQGQFIKSGGSSSSK